MAPSQTTSSALSLLKKVRDIIVSGDTVQSKLDHIVTNIADRLNVDVCSLYLLRAGDVLELCASEGLDIASLHQVRLMVGQGLVGDIAAFGRPLNIGNAPEHPQFLYIPQTGEERFHSLAGVPVIRRGQVIGVLSTQCETSEPLGDDAFDVLQTIGLIIAELLGEAELLYGAELAYASSQSLETHHITGSALAPGLAIGPVVIHQRSQAAHAVIADNPVAEQARLEGAMTAFRQSMDRLVAQSRHHTDAESRAIIETYRLFAYDQGWLRRMEVAIEAGLTAEAAVRRAQNEVSAHLAKSSSGYLRDRMRDIEDISDRLILHLSGSISPKDRTDLPDQFILVARSISAADLLEYSPGSIKALVLEENPATAHIVIIAKSLNIPVVGYIRQLLRLARVGDLVVVDGSHGDVFLRPSEEIEQTVRQHIEEQHQRRKAVQSVDNEPAVTKDGHAVTLYVNASLFVDVMEMQKVGAGGVGLFRTEIPYMVSRHFPDIEEQYQTYARVLKQADGKPVIFRTFDIGGDKQLPYLALPYEPNPAMGWRATRIGLDRPSLLKRQLRAMLMAAAGSELQVMFPFITEVSEIRRAKEMLETEIIRMRQDNKEVSHSVTIGVMLEIPALLWQMTELLEEVDFISVGSNDLLQYLFAADRESPMLGRRYNGFSPAAMRVFRDIIRRCDEAEVPVCFCGEFAADQAGLMALLGLGARRFSMAPSAIMAARHLVRQVDTVALASYVFQQLEKGRSLRYDLQDYARDHAIQWYQP